MYKRQFFRQLSAICILAILSGCASSREVAFPGRTPNRGPVSEEAHVLEVGNKVVITKVDGTTVRGKVTELEAGFIVVGWTGNYGYEEMEIFYGSIDEIQRTDTGNIWPFIGLAVAGFFAMVLHGLSQMG